MYAENLPPVNIIDAETKKESGNPCDGNGDGIRAPVEADLSDSMYGLVEGIKQPETANGESQDRKQSQTSGNLVEAILWLNSIPCMRSSIIQAIAAMPEFLENYPAVRAEYERQKGKIESPGAWIRSAFHAGYLHTATKEEKKAQKREAEKVAQKAKMEETRKEREREAGLERERAEFKEAYGRLEREIKESLAQQARLDEKDKPNPTKSDTLVRIRYVKLIREYFRKQGQDFSGQTPLGFSREISSDIFGG